MKKEIAELWAQALESGEYKQNFFALRNGDKFCCLGVLCNLHAQTHPEFAAKQNEINKYAGKGAFLPKIVMKWAGINDECVSMPNIFGIRERFKSLSYKNDNGHSFKEIANIIRENYEKL